MKKFEIEKFLPCKNGAEFYNRFNSFEEAWNSCERGDWMLWIAKKLDVDSRTLTLTKGYCAKTVIHLMKDARSKNSVKVAINFGKGKATVEQLNAAADAAAVYAAYADVYAAADAAYYDVYAADAAVYAADAAAAAAADAVYAAAAAAAAAVYAANAAADAADAADAAKKENQKKTADICRKYLTEIVFELIKK